MEPQTRNVAVLGCTGSIGTSTLEVIAASQGRLRVVALAARASTEQALRQAERFRPRWLIITDPDAAARQDWSALPQETELLEGSAGLAQVAADPAVHVVVAAIVGTAGLQSTWAALQAGKTVALANKETLVAAGSLVVQLADRHGGTIIPVDSEHSALFQAMQSGRRSEVRRVILTASGGPFRSFTSEQMALVTVDQALQHPNWDMGPKITVDSATMMNKALEIIEARWLFDLAPDQIDVVVHPQSMIHSLVEFIDGSVIAQLGPPDMRLPIQYALEYPHRREGTAPRLNLAKPLHFDFEPPDLARFPALQLGWEAARAGGTAGAVLNAANEAAVSEFLAGELAFHEIVPVCRRIIDRHPFQSHPTLETILTLDAWARQEVVRWVCT